MKLASVEYIASIESHPNADRLEIVTVLGYRCIVPKGKYVPGELCILIQPDTVLPDAPWAAFYKKNSNRVKAIRLRGEWSFGIVEGIDILGGDRAIIEYALPSIGKDISDELGVVKYESPQPNNLEAKGTLPTGLPKTDEERWQNIDWSQFEGLQCTITQKIDGQSFTAYYRDGVFGICGRTQEMKLDSDNNYTRNSIRYGLQEKLSDFCTTHNVNLALRGEQFGRGIQNSNNNPHSKLPLGLMFFSVWNFDSMKYECPDSELGVFAVCEALGLPTVPLLASKPFDKSIIDDYENRSDLFGNPFEGVVVSGWGWSFKIINLQYDSKK